MNDFSQKRKQFSWLVQQPLRRTISGKYEQIEVMYCHSGLPVIIKQGNCQNDVAAFIEKKTPVWRHR
jgi:hypothetical protein